MKTPEEIRQIVDDAINTAMAEIQGQLDPENVTDSGMHCELHFSCHGREFIRIQKILETYATSLDMAVDETHRTLTGSEAQDRANREWNDKCDRENKSRS
jgi:hypothetical protein